MVTATALIVEGMPWRIVGSVVLNQIVNLQITCIIIIIILGIILVREKHITFTFGTNYSRWQLIRYA